MPKRKKRIPRPPLLVTDPTDPNALMDERELSSILHVTVRCLQAWRLRGQGPPFCKLGFAVRYRRAAVAAFVAAHERTSTRSAGA